MTRGRAAMSCALLLSVLVARSTFAQPRPAPLPPGPNPPSSDVITVKDASIDRVHDWLEAVGDHEPGAIDAASSTIGGLSTSDLRTLWINTTVLLVLMREVNRTELTLSVGGLSIGKGGKANHFTVKAVGQKEREIQYRPVQLHRLRLMACAAVGVTSCPEPRKPDEVPVGLDRLSARAAASARAGDGNFTLRRGALLHADIAMTDAPVEDAGSAPSPAPRQMRVAINDGNETKSGEVAIHWVLARLLLDEVTPTDAKKPAPGRDVGVRAWYRATAAWMQRREDHDAIHLDHARDLFPADPDILFLSGCQREAFAAPRIHGAVTGATLPKGLGFDVASDRAELRRAEGYFRRALEARPDMAEAHLHLGRVLLLRQEYADATAHLRRAGPIQDPALEYYRSLFLGAAREMLGDYADARAGFSRAAELAPQAQSPLLALSELARRRGDRAEAMRHLQRVFALAVDDDERTDPWWSYATSQARNADALIDDVRKMMTATPGTPQ